MDKIKRIMLNKYMIFPVKAHVNIYFGSILFLLIIKQITHCCINMSNDSEKSKIRKKTKQNCRTDINEECISYLISKVLISPANLAIYRPCK